MSDPKDEIDNNNKEQSKKSVLAEKVDKRSDIQHDSKKVGNAPNKEKTDKGIITVPPNKDDPKHRVQPKKDQKARHHSPHSHYGEHGYHLYGSHFHLDPGHPHRRQHLGVPVQGHHLHHGGSDVHAHHGSEHGHHLHHHGSQHGSDPGHQTHHLGTHGHHSRAHHGDNHAHHQGDHGNQARHHGEKSHQGHHHGDHHMDHGYHHHEYQGHYTHHHGDHGPHAPHHGDHGHHVPHHDDHGHHASHHGDHGHHALHYGEHGHHASHHGDHGHHALHHGEHGHHAPHHGNHSPHHGYHGHQAHHHGDHGHQAHHHEDHGHQAHHHGDHGHHAPHHGYPLHYNANPHSGRSRIRKTRNFFKAYSNITGSYHQYDYYSNSSSDESGIAYENTFKLEPEYEFDSCAVRKIILDVLSGNLQDKEYDPLTMKKESKDLSDAIKERVKALKMRRFKIVTLVLIGERKDQSVQISSRCLWDQRRDNFATATVNNLHLYATGMVFGTYFE